VHTREVPNEWPGLLSFTERLVKGDTQVPVKRLAVLRLLNKLRPLTGEQLEANYYYGLGQIICGVSTALKDKDTRQRLIRTSAVGLLMNAASQRLDIPKDMPFVPKVREIKPGFPHQPFKKIASEAWQELPPAERVLTDALTYATFFRRAPLIAKALLVTRAFVRVREGGVAAARVADETLSGVTAVTQILLTGRDPVKGPSREELDALAPSERFVAAWDPATALRAARLRLDEFHAGKGWHDASGKPAIDPKFFASPPQPLSECPLAMQNHESRLICPAVQADGFAAQVAYQIFPEIMTTAYQIVPADLIERHKSS